MAVKITLDRDACIGCGSCTAVCPKYWEMGDDGKTTLKGSKDNVLEIEEAECNMDAAQSCPVNCIHIEIDGEKKI
ncbi:ferredoxin [Candidatus Micrarchaeota archaeon]|nr:ferredoxin [Candidatus Micrarchaeota archaeon]